MEVSNPNLPCNEQNIDNLPLSEDELYHPRLASLKKSEPCARHKIAFPSANRRLYPEVKNIPVYICSECGWFCYEGSEK